MIQAALAKIDTLLESSWGFRLGLSTYQGILDEVMQNQPVEGAEMIRDVETIDVIDGLLESAGYSELTTYEATVDAVRSIIKERDEAQDWGGAVNDAWEALPDGDKEGAKTLADAIDSLVSRLNVAEQAKAELSAAEVLDLALAYAYETDASVREIRGFLAGALAVIGPEE